MSAKKRRKSKKHRSRRNKRRWSPAEIAILAVAAVILCVSAFQLISIVLEYKAGTDAYDSLLDRYVQVNGEKVERQNDETEAADGEEERFPDISIDFDELVKINGDLTGWIYIPALDIEYPVVKGTDNIYYLTHTFEKKENKAGAIFMDFGANAQMTDYNTFIYGHNMKNGSMFGRLKKFIRDEELCDSRPYLYYFTREKTYQYLIISYYVTVDGSSSYFLPATQEEYEDYLDLILANSVYKCKKEIPYGAPILSLSTCYGNAGGTQRFLVHGILTEVQDVGQTS